MKRNHFTNKFSAKSSQELKGILDSKQHVDEAKLAAKWILEERGQHTDYQPTKRISKEKRQWILGRKQSPSHRRRYEWKMIAFGIGCIIGAFYINFDNLVTTKSSLVELKGTIQNSDVIVDNVSSRSRMGYNAKSRRATLFFSLIEHPKLFRLSENIGQDYSHEEYEHISKNLKNSATVTVWINKNKLNDSNPKVFQIDINERTILDFNTIKTEHVGIFIFTLLVGIGMTGLGLYSKYPERTRRLLGMNVSAKNKTHE